MGLPMALTVVGGLFSAASSVMAGQAQARAYEAKAKMAENALHYLALHTFTRLWQDVTLSPIAYFYSPLARCSIIAH